MSPIVRLALIVGDVDQHLSMAGLIKRAIACEVAPAELAPDVLDGNSQSAGQKVVTEPTDGLLPAELQRMRVTPLGRSTHHDGSFRESRSFATRPLKPLRHQS
jgi:hypothetical protein